MFRNRKRQEGLPTSVNAAPSAFHFPSSKNGGNNGTFYPAADGSGKAIRMEAPLKKAWRKASVHTKGSYYALLGCILLIYFGYRWLRWNHSSIHLICHTEECTFSITPQGWMGSHKVSFPRHQLLLAQAMKVTKEGKFVSLSPRMDDFQDPPGKGKNKNKKKTTSYKGPDRNNHYPSYRITFREKIVKNRKQQPDDNDPEQTGDSVDGSPQLNIPDVPLTDVAPFLEKVHDQEGDYVNQLSLIIRQFGIFHSRRRVKTSVQKIDSYIKRRRHKLTVKENTPPAWQGILMLVLGIFGLLLTCLIGQFSEPETTRRQAGPGTRNRSTPNYKGERPSVAKSLGKTAVKPGNASAVRQRKAY